jgi:hypothetical protein
MSVTPPVLLPVKYELGPGMPPSTVWKSRPVALPTQMVFAPITSTAAQEGVPAAGVATGAAQDTPELFEIMIAPVAPTATIRERLPWMRKRLAVVVAPR